MAFLETNSGYNIRGKAKLELTPHPPTPRELVDTYVLRLWVGNELIYDMTHSVRNWQMRHYYLREIATACCNVRNLIGKEIRYEPKTPKEADEGREFYSLLHSYFDADWLRITLAVGTSARHGDLVQVKLFLLLRKRNRAFLLHTKMAVGELGTKC